MKQFFKSTAILACFALLFSACSDDGTEDVVSSSVLGESEIRVVYPGNCQAWVKWVVPEDSNINSCQLSWTNSDGTSSGAATFDAQTGWMEKTLTDVPAGTYTFTLQNFTKSGTGSSVNTYADVEIYDQNTYADVFPTVVATANTTGSTITWENVDEDCIGVYVTYTNTSDKEVTTDFTSIDSPTVLTDAKSCSNFTYVASYRPTFEYLGATCTGLDIIDVTCTERFAFPDASPVTPLDMVLSPGTNKFKVEWFTSQVTEITYIDIVIDGPGFSDQDTVRLSTSGILVESSDLGKSVVGSFTKGVVTELLFMNNNDFETLGDDAVKTQYHDASNTTSTYSPFKQQDNKIEAGDYTVTIYTVKGLTGTYSEPTTMTVSVYDESKTYTYHPAIDEISFDGVDARVEWATTYELNGETIEVEDCVGVEVTYLTSVSDGAETAKTSMTAIDEVTLMEGAYYTYTESNNIITPTSTFTYRSYFLPENGLDQLFIENTDATNLIPVQSPTKPSDVEMYPGDNMIYVYFTLASDSFIDGVRFTYYSEDGEVLAVEDLEAKNLNLGDENEYGLTSAVTAGSTYSVGIQTYNDTYSSTSVMQTFDDLEVYDFASFSATCSAPYISSYEFDESSCQFTVQWDAQVMGGEIEFTYVYNLNGDTKTLIITDYDEDMILTDLMPGSSYTYKASFIPVPNAMDVLEFAAITAEVPDAIISKSYFLEYPQQTVYLNGNYLKGSIYCNNTYTNGVTNANWAFSDLWNKSYQKNSSSGTARYEFGLALAYGYDGSFVGVEVPAPAANMTINIDLGKTYRVSRFALHYYINTGFSSTNVKSFSLWGTSYEDPVYSSDYNNYNSDGTTPDLTYWDCILSNVVILQPSANNIDYNGDEIVDTSDDEDYMYAGIDSDNEADGTGMCWETDADAVPIRYLRIQIHADVSDTFSFRIQEIDLWQSGFLESEWTE